MSIDKVDNNIYRFNGYSNYPQMSTPTMRAVDTDIQPQTNYTQYSNLSPLSNDTVSISASDQIKGSNSKKGMSTLTKVGLTALGIGATAYACLVGHRMLTKPSIDKVAKNFSEIFGKDISKEEAETLITKYKDIFAEKDKDKFIQKCFKQVKNDFGYENIDIEISKLSEETIKEYKKNGWNLGGGYRPIGSIFKKVQDGTHITFNSNVIDINPHESKFDIFASIVHELTHAKQHEMCYRADKQRFFETLKEARFSESKGKPYYENITNEYIQMIEDVYGNVWGRLPKIEKGSSEYKNIETYFNEMRNYKGGGSSHHDDGYMEQLIEKEAHGTKPLVNDIYNYFAPVWRV